MPVDNHWAVPELEFLAATTASDSTELQPLLGAPIQADHVHSVSRAQQAAGFDGVLITDTPSSPDAFVLGTQVLAATDKLRAIIAVRPGPAAPTAAYRALATLERFHPRRVGQYFPPVDNDGDYRREGDQTTRTERQARRAEFVDVLAVLATANRPVHFAGRHYRLEGVWSPLRPSRPLPVYLSGLSTAADELAARAADVYLIPSEPSARVRARIARVRAAATREVRFGLRLRPIIADTPAAAHALAERIIRTRSAVPPARMTGALDDAGELVGTTETVAASIARYAELGVRVFQLHGYQPRTDPELLGDVIERVRGYRNSATIRKSA